MKKNYATILPLSDIRKNEFTVYVCLQSGNIAKLKKLLKMG